MTTHLRRRAVLDSEVEIESTATVAAIPVSPSSKYSDDVNHSPPIVMKTYSYTGNGSNFNKNPLKPGKDGEERLAEIFRAAADGGGNGIGIGIGSAAAAAIDAASAAEGGTKNDITVTTGSSTTQHNENPDEVNASWYTAGVSYFPDQVARYRTDIGAGIVAVVVVVHDPLPSVWECEPNKFARDSPNCITIWSNDTRGICFGRPRWSCFAATPMPINYSIWCSSVTSIGLWRADCRGKNRA
ncbi:hypothetical protein FRACYDRAFT_242297 [Fragilariopsis cylindrus CCMP1102]|uniref:Uncharacterized protein n=1 Tax=Fragilariopsis cylindrus CCMP1102 TaxID=635003 RepID=A0A1E7F757_9STRA|nr:hypothetical protein FRACYDRAFT_242297 [Fragilariopsis cylindrus CCMP1102]|eukprot:OEU13944.1 hypothetical protein FRACYDRAFT_242297 [Fragilariopsis cylindrus CCMP1102]